MGGLHNILTERLCPIPFGGQADLFSAIGHRLRNLGVQLRSSYHSNFRTFHSTYREVCPM